MSFIDSDIQSRAEALGATDEGFVAWAKFEYRLTIKPERVERWKNKLWDSYLQTLEYGEIATREFRGQYEKP